MVRVIGYVWKWGMMGNACMHRLSAKTPIECIDFWHQLLAIGNDLLSVYDWLLDDPVAMTKNLAMRLAM